MKAVSLFLLLYKAKPATGMLRKGPHQGLREKAQGSPKSFAASPLTPAVCAPEGAILNKRSIGSSLTFLDSFTVSSVLPSASPYSNDSLDTSFLLKNKSLLYIIFNKQIAIVREKMPVFLRSFYSW